MVEKLLANLKSADLFLQWILNGRRMRCCMFQIPLSNHYSHTHAVKYHSVEHKLAWLLCAGTIISKVKLSIKYGTQKRIGMKQTSCVMIAVFSSCLYSCGTVVFIFTYWIFWLVLIKPVITEWVKIISLQKLKKNKEGRWVIEGGKKGGREI